MRSYLLKGLSLLCLIAISTQAAQYDNLDFNEEVSRRIVLDQQSVLEVISEIRFKSSSNQDKSTYYFTIPRSLDEHLIHLNAEDTGSGDEVKVTRIDQLSPSILSQYSNKKNASDVIFFRIDIKLQKGPGIF